MVAVGIPVAGNPWQPSFPSEPLQFHYNHFGTAQRGRGSQYRVPSDPATPEPQRAGHNA
jgi:hypothetical protein